MGREEERPSPRHVLDDPGAPTYSRTACHVSQPTLTCSSRAPPPPRPRPGPPDPSPCSVCAACLQRQRAPRKAQGAPPMIGLQESRRILQRSVPVPRPGTHPPTQFPHLLAYPLPGSFRPLHSLPRPSSRSPRTLSPHQGLHLEGPDGTFGFEPSLSPAHRPTEQQQQQTERE